MSGIFKKPTRRVDRVFIHCSASDHANHDNIATIRKWHLARGFSDIGYHFFIHKSGKVSKGRPIKKIPAAQRGNNTGTIAICLHGLLKEKFTQAQYSALRSLCTKINNAYFKNISFHGHREVAAKACPVFDYKKVLKLDNYGSLGLDSSIVRGVEATSDFTELNYGDQGDEVKKLQKLLGIKADGDYGKKTLKAVKEFKQQHNLYPSGIVTKQVWQLLSKPILENIRIADASRLPDLQMGSRGKSVEFLQELLFLKVDGIFGSNTAKYVKAFKEEHGYYPSDIVQQHIWKLLLEVRRIEHYE
ncbi:MAG: N-acetylmuramoyl-L-alanine amidase [Epsilonproteobacteria bacterium]|nr:MAG: N-acetylmuramoyl-L-alanine amidase [Campylobacterota bacterium]